MKKNFIISFETGVGGGSLSLLKDGEEIDFWEGEKTVSRAEDLLVQVEILLRRNNVSIKEIKTLFVSKGPGSFTGLRIGVSTAKGLGKAINCECFGVSVLDAMLFDSTAEGNVLVAVNSGRETIWGQVFKREGLSLPPAGYPPAKIELKSLEQYIEKNKISVLLLEKTLYEKVERHKLQLNTNRLRRIKTEAHLSRLIALKGIHVSPKEGVLPIFYPYEPEK